MPNTPSVNFNFVNNNVKASTPQLGISHVLARTTKGPFNRPDEVFSTYSQFQAVYGEEIVPDGTISNIKKAFELGSKLRISRVAGGNNPSYGYADDESASISAVTCLILELHNPAADDEEIKVSLALRTKEMGSAIVDPNAYGLQKDFYLQFEVVESAKNVLYLTQAKSTQYSDPNQILDKRAVISGTDAFVDVNVFRDFVNNVPNVEFEVVNIEFTPTNAALANRYKANGIQGVVSLLQDYQNWGLVVNNAAESTFEKLDLVINEGNNGGDSTAETWANALNAIVSYEDAYQLALSHVHQHLPNDFTAVYKAAADLIKPNVEVIIYVEVPKNNADGTARTAAENQAALETMVQAIGQDKCIAYFGGGIKYYDMYGAERNCDVLGTVLGLGDAAASMYGPWYSFAGMNRGIVTDALGSVMENLGSSIKKPILQQFAEWYMNLFVIKDTKYYGKRTMLWHSFTSHPKSDSYRFLSIMRLNLYIKKNLRTILNSYIEEPNTFPTWKNIYFEVKDIFTDLVDRRAITSWTWLGDQYAQSYSELSINNEADVRAGKYHAQVKFKDVVTLQEITMDIITDASTGDIEISEL